MIYIRSDLCFTRINSFKDRSSEHWSGFKTEFIALKLKLGRNWITIVGIYRPPSVPKTVWKCELSSIFEATIAISRNVYYLGDLNADLLDPDRPPKDGRTLLDLLDIFDLHCLINKATRKARTSETLLDVILTNNKKTALNSDVVDTQISDHSLVYCILRSRAPILRSRKICFRSLKSYSQEKMLNDLHKVPFLDVMEVFDDIDDKLYAFEQLYSDILDEHAPVKQTHIRGNQVPYMTEDWRKAIRHRNKLWKIFMRDRARIVITSCINGKETNARLSDGKR